jgi:sugar lactone lactonase YvrE
LNLLILGQRRAGWTCMRMERLMRSSVCRRRSLRAQTRAHPLELLARIPFICGLLLVFAALNPAPSNAGTTAAREVGQPDFVHRSPNAVDAATISVGGQSGGVALDTSVTPNRLYISDPNNNRVLGYRSVAALLSGASADIVIGQPDFFSNIQNNGSGLNPVSAASLADPRGVAVDGAGNLYVADRNNCRVLVFSNPFAINASTGQTAGFTADVVIGQVGDFTSDMCGGSTASADALDDPDSVALDKFGNLYIADSGDNRVLEFDAPIDSGTIGADEVFGQLGSFTTKTANNGGISKDSLNGPTGVALDQFNNLYVADTGNNRVLEYNTPFSTTGIAGSGDTSADQVWGQLGSFSTGTANSGGTSASSLDNPRRVALDSSGNLYVSDFINSRVLEYNEGANPPTNLTANHIFGQTIPTADACNQSGVLPNASTLCNPSGVALDSTGDLFVVDGNNNRALKYATPLTNNVADLVLGQPDFVHFGTNFVDGAVLNTQKQIAIDRSVTPNHLYVADMSNNRVLGWLNATGFANGATADLVIGQPDPYSSGINVNGGSSPTASTLWSPQGVAVDATGNLYVADSLNNRVLEYTTPFTACAGKFPCIGGGANQVYGQPDLNTRTSCASPPSSTTLCQPQQVAVDSFGNLYVADSVNNRVLEYNTPLAAGNDAPANLVFGQGSATNFATSDCNHPSGAVSANTLCDPMGVAVDPGNNLYVGDWNNNRVLEFNETVSKTQAPANVTANTVFGQSGSFTLKSCVSPTNTTSTDTLCTPAGVAVDPSGNLYVVDEGDSRVLMFTTPSSNTVADVVWGQGGDLVSNKCNLSAPEPSAGTLCGPYGVATDAAGGVYISDTGNNRVTAYELPFPPPGLSIVAKSEGILKLRPATQIHFGSLEIGKHRDREVTFVNRSHVPVRIFSINVSGDFAYTSSCESTLAPEATCKLAVTFTPIASGHRGGSILISDDAGDNPHVFELYGYGRRPLAR